MNQISKVEEAPHHANIVAALAAAQSEMTNAAKDRDNPHFKSKYADLASVRDACLPALSRHGIAVIQPFVMSETGDMVVETRFLYGSDVLSCPIPVLLGKRDMQGLGSAMTYARRYGLMALAGIAPEDDDGNAAAANVRETNPTQNAAAMGIRDAWRGAVLDSLPEDATPRQKAEAFAKAICEDFAGKGQRALDNAWNRHKRMIEEMQGRHADLHGQIADAYETRSNELVEAAREKERVE